MPDELQTRIEKFEVLAHHEFQNAAPTIGMGEDAFGLFYDRTARRLWAYLQRASGDRDLTDDLLQESYCRMLSANLPTMDEAESKCYLFRVATNLLRDRWRRRQIVNRLAAPAEAVEVDLESRADTRRAFEQLRPRERQLLWLAYVEGSSHKDIAGITGLRVGSIRLLLFRARRKLAAALRLHHAHQSGKKDV